MTQRFTIDGSAALEHQLAGLCDQVREGVLTVVPAGRLEALVLAGGYGRGEGGVLRTGESDAPYNDLEFFVFIRGNTFLNDRRYRSELHRLGEKLTLLAGIDVEFKILSLAKLRHSAPSMFYYDLVTGHRWLGGKDAMFAGCDHHRDAAGIPLHEATRLLFNRCSGLLFARERLHRANFSDHDADFVGRNVAKARLALGDVWLTIQGRYHWSCIERMRRLGAARDPWSRRLESHHRTGVAFKLHPQRAHTGSKEELAAALTEITGLAEELWLHLESRRTGRSFRSPVEYARTALSLCSERSALRNAFCNLRAFGSHGLVSKFRARYPRERLLRALSLLLWGQTTGDNTAIISSCLNCGNHEFAAAVEVYESLWHQFN